MPNLTVGRIIRLHAAVLGVLLAASLPAFAAVSSHLAAIDGPSISTGLALLVGVPIWLRTRRPSA